MNTLPFATNNQPARTRSRVDINDTNIQWGPMLIELKATLIGAGKVQVFESRLEKAFNYRHLDVLGALVAAKILGVTNGKTLARRFWHIEGLDRLTVDQFVALVKRHRIRALKNLRIYGRENYKKKKALPTPTPAPVVETERAAPPTPEPALFTEPTPPVTTAKPTTTTHQMSALWQVGDRTVSVDLTIKGVEAADVRATIEKALALMS